MSWVKRLSATFAAQAVKPVPYLALLSSPLQACPETLLKSAKGLQAVQPIHRDNGHTAFLTYWATPEHFQRGSADVAQQLQVTSTLYEGLAGDLQLPIESKWKAVKLSTVLLSTAALLGALEVVTNRYERLFASPELALRADKQAFSVVETEDIATSVTVENLLPVAEHRDIAVTAALVDSSGNHLPLAVQDPQMSSLSATKSRAFNIVGKVPAPGEYKLRVGVQAKAGWLRDGKSFVTESRLTSWPRTPRGSLRLKDSRSTNADYVVLVEVGSAAPFGVLCELTVTGVGKLGFDRGEWRSIEPTHVGKYLQAGTGDAATSRLRWSWPLSVSQQNLRAELTFLGDTTTNWPLVAKKAKVECTPLKEKIDVVT